MNRRSFSLAAAAIAASAASGCVAAPGSPGSAAGRGARPEVRLAPEFDFNALVAGAPPQARFILAPGTYRGWSVEPRHGQRFEAGEQGVVLDGGGGRHFAFRGSAEDVELVGFTVQDYETMDPPGGNPHPPQLAAIEVPDGRNWQLIDLTVQRIGGRGVSLNQGMHIQGGRYIDNGHVGVAGRGPGAVIERAEMARNNARRYGSHWESGAYKNVGGSWGGQLPPTRGAKLIGCHIHHNIGRAVWFDWDCLEATVEGCVIHDNTHDGIAYEACAGGTFRDCLIGFNNISGHDGPLVWAADLMLQNAKDCLVTGCTIVAARGCALSIAHHTRREGHEPPQDQGFYIGTFDGLRNRITDNTFILMDDAAGLVIDVNAPPGPEPVLASNVLGPNRWLARPGARERRLWLDRPWSDDLGTLEEHADLDPFVPAELYG